jgi:hypothetical protein
MCYCALCRPSAWSSTIVIPVFYYLHFWRDLVELPSSVYSLPCCAACVFNIQACERTPPFFPGPGRSEGFVLTTVWQVENSKEGHLGLWIPAVCAVPHLACNICAPGAENVCWLGIWTGFCSRLLCNCVPLQLSCGALAEARTCTVWAFLLSPQIVLVNLIGALHASPVSTLRGSCPCLLTFLEEGGSDPEPISSAQYDANFYVVCA